MMKWEFLDELFYNLFWDRFEIPKENFTSFFNNSIVNVVEFFSNHTFETYWNDILTDVVDVGVYPLEKEISPGDIYSIINGAKPLIIEWTIMLWDEDDDVPEYKKTEVWLNK